MIAGRYSLDREIGRGGMGAVWLGVDEVLGRPVALKRIGLLPGADSTDLARAEREARLAARLNHPHVVAVFNFAEDTDTGSRWLVMEYVEGTTLARLVRDEGALSPDEAAPILRAAADALVAAHSAGIVHRDVKPSNILVGDDGQVKLTDFGIARLAGDPALTQTGLVTGSPAYLAPEAAAGQSGDASVDVWSLGATAFHLLAGRPPYDAGDHVLGGLYKIVNEEPPRLPDAGWLTPMLEGTMVKDPAARWSMEQVRDFLDGHGAPGEDRTAVLPAPPAATSAATSAGAVAAPPADRTEVRSRRPAPGLLVGLGLVAVLALGVFLVLHDGSSPASNAGGSPSRSSSPTASSSPSPSASASSSPTSSPSPSPSPTATPTAGGMKAFVRGYVRALSTDPDTAWPMLTPRFQRESGGLATYRRFWGDVGTGRVLDVAVDPRNLVVSYHVKFTNFGTGKRPTVLDLVYDHGRYRIDGEHSEGFTPAA